MKTLKEILERQTAIRSELLTLEKVTEPTEEDTQFQDTLLEEFDELEEQRKPLATRMQRLDAVRYAAQDEENTEQTAEQRKPKFGTGPDSVISITKDRDPFENIDAIRSGKMLVTRSELRGRALDAIERSNKLGTLMPEFAENATQLAQRDPSLNAGIARHILDTGSDEYMEAFQDYLRNPEGMAQRTALSLSNANGGYLLPFVLDPTIVLTNAASANPYRRISNVKTTTSNTWNGVTSAGITAAWLAEGTAAADNTPTVGNIQITPLKAAAWLFGSFEVLADTDFGSQLPGLLQDAKDRLEEAAFAVGTGTAQPKGVVTAATTTVSTVTTGAYVVADAYALHAALPPRFRNSEKAAFIANVAQINRTRQLDTAGGASFWTNLGQGAPEQLLGKGIYESSSMASALTTTSKVMVFGDFSQYYIVDRVGVSIIYEPMITGTGASANLPTGQSGWFMFWRVGADAAVPGAFRTLVT
jgi:HK97 family phage major capsid protein